MRELTVLLSASGSPTAPGFVECLKNNGEREIRIIGIDMTNEPSVKYLVDKFYVVPPVRAEDYCDIVLDICRKEKVDIYFPNISAELESVTKRNKEFEDIGVRVSASNYEAVNISNNKLHTYQLLESLGIPVPKFYAIHSVQDFIVGCEYMGYPEKAVCIKIVNGSGSRGVRIIDANRNRYDIFVKEKPNSFFVSYEDMLSILKSVDVLDEMMLVEYMPGNEYSVDLLADQGKVLYEVGRENVVSLMSIAQESVVVKNDEAYHICEEIVKVMKLDGNIGFDFMKNADGRPVLMDINPRITATVSVIAAAGINLPYLQVKRLLKEDLPRCSVKYGTRLKRRYGEIYTDVDGERVYIGDWNKKQ